MKKTVISILGSLASKTLGFHPVSEKTPSFSFSFIDIDIAVCLTHYLTDTSNVLDTGWCRIESLKRYFSKPAFRQKIIIDCLLPNFSSALRKHEANFESHNLSLESIIGRVLSNIAEKPGELTQQPMSVWHDAMEEVLWVGCFSNELVKHSTSIAELEMGGYQSGDFYANYCLLTPKEACSAALHSLDRDVCLSAKPPLMLVS